MAFGGDFDLGHAIANEQVVTLAHEHRDVHVHLVAAMQSARDNNAANEMTATQSRRRRYRRSCAAAR
jgi:hypothetical protein